MKKITLLSFLWILATISVHGQVIYEEDFNNGTLDGWTTYDEDGLNISSGIGFITDAWNIIDRDGEDGDFGGPAGDYAAMSTSWYDPPGTSNDWLVSPQIVLEEHSMIEFDAKAQDPDYPDGYELWLSTEGNEPDDFNHTLLVVPQEYGSADNDYKHRTVDLSDYANQEV